MCTWDTDTTLCETQTLDFMQQRRMHQSIHFSHYYVKIQLMGEFINKQMHGRGTSNTTQCIQESSNRVTTTDQLNWTVYLQKNC